MLLLVFLLGCFNKTISNPKLKLKFKLSRQAAEEELKRFCEDEEQPPITYITLYASLLSKFSSSSAC